MKINSSLTRIRLILDSYLIMIGSGRIEGIGNSKSKDSNHAFIDIISFVSELVELVHLSINRRCHQIKYQIWYSKSDWPLRNIIIHMRKYFVERSDRMNEWWFAYTFWNFSTFMLTQTRCVHTFTFIHWFYADRTTKISIRKCRFEMPT